MDKSHQPDIMVTLGRSLVLRRMQLGYGERQRRRFLDERGPTSVDYKTIARLEQGKGHIPDKVTSAEVEALYGLAPGSFRDSIVTGELTVVPTGDPVWDDLRAHVMAFPWLTGAEKSSVLAHVRRLRRAEVTPQRSAEPARSEEPFDDGVLAGMGVLAARVTEQELAQRRAS